MIIQGRISTIIFKNEDNDWTVMLVKLSEGYITAVGSSQGLDVGDEIELDGEESLHKVYGKQFKFSTYKKILPTSDVALVQYISENVKGIGKKTAKRIIEKFGKDTIDVIRYEPSNLNEIKGLNSDKIDQLNTFFLEEWEKWNTVEYLSKFSIPAITATKIFQILGKDTIKIIKENPYSLLKFVKKIEFKLVDKIAMSIGITLDNDDRINSGIIYAINTITEFGHTCIEKEILVKYSADILNVSTSNIEDGISRLIFQNLLYLQNINETEYVFRKSFYLAEENIAEGIVKLSLNSTTHVNYSKQIEEVSKKNSLVLSDEQKEAISSCLNHNISVITGGPGTGKTTIIKCVIDILEKMQKKYVLCAPTGRAAKRIKETTGKEAKTLHRLLEITKLDDNDIDSYYECIVANIEADIVIIDEASMIDCMMMNNLFKALKSNTKVVMVGDVDQLPSVGPGSVLKDVIESDVVNVVKLKQIYRQSAMSDIILNAHRVNEGKYPEFKTKDTDMYFIKTESIESTLSEISSLISSRLEKFANLNVKKDLQILTPMKKTSLGTVELNSFVQRILNPKKDGVNEKEFGGKIFRVGDKVMQTINNYDKKFSIGGEFFDGIYNGDIGYVKSIDNLNKKMIVLFDEEKEVEYEFDELEQLELAYAITIHKSQGSEFDYVILPLYVGYQKLFTRNLLYTAMTRAKKMLIIIGSKNIINYMTQNVESKNRKTGLKEKIISKLI